MKNKILIGSICFLLIIGIIVVILLKPKIELNKAIEYLKKGEYSKAYAYVYEKNNENNKIIIQELLTEIFCSRAGKGMERVINITTKATNIIYETDMTNINYTADDQLNIDVVNLDNYIALEKEITRDMIAVELRDTYDLYFKDLKFARQKFYNFLNNVKDEEFTIEINNMANDFTKQSNDFFSYADNHKYNPKTKEIFEEIQKYLINY